MAIWRILYMGSLIGRVVGTNLGTLADLVKVAGQVRFIRASIDALIVACRLRANSTAPGIAMSGAERRYSFTASVAGSGALRMLRQSTSTVSSSCASGTTSLARP